MNAIIPHSAANQPANPWVGTAGLNNVFDGMIAQFGDHAAIIGIAAGRSRKVARHRENEIAFHQSGASYQARAFGDSPTVTRIAEISFGSRPSLPAFTAAAN